MYFINVFLSYSILGYLFELIVALIMDNKLNSGIMFGPWTPIYGFGVLIMIFVKKRLEKLKLNKWLEIILYFLIIIISLTILEQIGGVLLEKIFNKELWNYSNLKFHLTKYTALEISLGWSIGAIILIYLIHPKLKKILLKVPFLITAITFIIFITDTIITFFKFI